MAYQFGVASAPGSYGYIQNYSSNLASELGEARDENGDVAEINHYNETEEVSFEYVFDGTAPAVGDVLTIDTVKFSVLTVNMVESNTDYKRMTVTAKRYLTNTVPA